MFCVNSDESDVAYFHYSYESVALSSDHCEDNGSGLQSPIGFPGVSSAKVAYGHDCDQCGARCCNAANGCASANAGDVSCSCYGWTCESIVNSVYAYEGDPTHGTVIGAGALAFDGVDDAGSSTYTHFFQNAELGIFQMSLSNNFDLCKAVIVIPDNYESFMVGELKIEIADGSGTFSEIATQTANGVDKTYTFKGFAHRYVADRQIRITLTPPTNTGNHYLIITELVFSGGSK